MSALSTAVALRERTGIPYLGLLLSTIQYLGTIKMESSNTLRSLRLEDQAYHI